jgi:hypothetical protein
MPGQGGVSAAPAHTRTRQVPDGDAALHVCERHSLVQAGGRQAADVGAQRQRHHPGARVVAGSTAGRWTMWRPHCMPRGGSLP